MKFTKRHKPLSVVKYYTYTFIHRPNGRYPLQVNRQVFASCPFDFPSIPRTSSSPNSLNLHCCTVLASHFKSLSHLYLPVLTTKLTGSNPNDYLSFALFLSM